MGKLENYLSNSFKYVFSDVKKGLIGGLLSSISGAIGAVFGIIFSIFLIHYINPNEVMGMDYNFLFSTLIVASFGFLIALIVGFIIDGYYVRVMKTTVENYHILPDWDNIIDLLKRGFVYFVGEIVLSIIFAIIPILFIVVGAFLVALSGILGAIFMGFGFLLLIILTIAYLIYKGLAEVNYSIKGFSGFFEFREIFRMINLNYIILIIVVGVVVMIINFIVQLPLILLKIFAIPPVKYSTFSPLEMIVDVISAVVSAFVGFYTAVFAKRAIALFYKDRVEELKNKN
ncbi:MAG: DUF4013 domain-containing protein [Methanocaldococcus sp.]